jgi:hypothetical protein
MDTITEEISMSNIDQLQVNEREQVDVSLDIGRMQGYATARAIVCAEIIAELEESKMRLGDMSMDSSMRRAGFNSAIDRAIAIVKGKLNG